jgi:hypothetical protein
MHREARRHLHPQGPDARRALIADIVERVLQANDLMTAGNRSCPAFVNTNACGRRSKSCAPINFSSAMTCLDKALWDISNALAAAVKLRCLATPSKARSAFNGSQRRSILVFAIRTSP